MKRKIKRRMFGLITGPALPDEQREIDQSCNAVANAWQTPWQVSVPRPSNAMNPRLWRLPAVHCMLMSDYSFFVGVELDWPNIIKDEHESGSSEASTSFQIADGGLV
jgi:hypothetical protein